PFDHRAVSHADRIVAISENVRRRVARYYGREAEVVYPPVATSRFRFQEVGDAWLSVGRLYPEKRIDLLFEIFRRLPKEKLILVGGYAAGDRAADYLARLNPPPNVTMMGEMPDEALVDLYATCRGLVTTAVDEDFGITPVEAMAAGKCVLATGEVGPRDGSHGPRRLVSDGTPSEKGVRSVWTRPTTERPEHGQHPAHRRSGHAHRRGPDRPVFPERRGQGGRPRRGLQPRGPIVRRDLVRPTGPDGRDHGPGRRAPFGGRPRECSRCAVLPGLVQRNVR